MNTNQSLHIPENGLVFGVYKADGRVLHISEARNGLHCNCICPACGATLIAKQGDRNAHHFAHYRDQACTKGCETALHKAAKQVLETALAIQLPALITEVTATAGASEFRKSRTGTATVCEAQVMTLRKVELERVLDDVKPDALLYHEDWVLAVEIAVTHFVDEDKRKKLKGMDLPCFEIDLSRGEFLDWNSLRAHVLDSIEGKTWIFHPDLEEVHGALLTKLRAELDAELAELMTQRQAEQTAHEAALATTMEQEKRLRQQLSETLRKLLSAPPGADAERPVGTDLATWKRVSWKLGRRIDELPDFLNHPVVGEAIFNCDRRVWQAGIFCDFILGKFDRYDSQPWPFDVKRVSKWCFEHLHHCLNRDALFLWKHKHSLSPEELRQLQTFDLRNALWQFLHHLMDQGYLRYVGRSRFQVIRDRLETSTQGFSHHRDMIKTEHMLAR